MANEEESKEVEKKSQPKSKSKSLLIIGLALVVLLGAGGASIYFKVINLKSLHLPWIGGSAKAEMKPAFYPMNTFLVNLADPGSKRFLKVTMELELNSKGAAAECKTIDFKLRDLFLTVLSSQQSYDIVTAPEKLALKRKLIASVNHVLPKGKVLDIYFTEFLIQ